MGRFRRIIVTLCLVLILFPISRCLTGWWYDVLVYTCKYFGTRLGEMGSFRTTIVFAYSLRPVRIGPDVPHPGLRCNSRSDENFISKKKI